MLLWFIWSALAIAAVLLVVHIRGRHARLLLAKIPVARARSCPWLPAWLGGSHFLDLLRGSPWEVMHRWCQQAPVVRFHFLGVPFVVVSDPQVIQHVLSNRDRRYAKDPYTFQQFSVLLGKGLVTSEGSLWRRQRALLTHVFRSSILHEVKDISFRAARRLVQHLNVHSVKGDVFKMAPLFRHQTLQVIGEVVLSMTAEECNSVFPQLYLPIAVECNKRTWAPWRGLLPIADNFRFHRNVKRLNTFLTNLIVQRAHAFAARGGPSSKVDILERVLIAAASVSSGEPDAGPNLLASWSASTPAVLQIRDEVKTFLLAGHETSASMLSWALYQLSCRQNSKRLQRVRREATRCLGDIDITGDMEWPTADDVKGLEYTLCVLKEALRLYSIVPIVVRKLREDDSVGLWVFPGGARVILHIQAVHNRNDLWERPRSFEPERFLGKFPANAWIPFSSGPRACIGKHLALLEAKIVLGVLVSHFDFRVEDGELGQPHPSMVPIGPYTGLSMTVRKRPCEEQ